MDGYSLVLNPLVGGYAEGFNRNAEYEFHRKEWTEPKRFRLADCHPAFNVAGLYYRKVN